MSDRTVDQIVEEAAYARKHAEASVVLPSVLVSWVKALADDVDTLAAEVERLRAAISQARPE